MKLPSQNILSFLGIQIKCIALFQKVFPQDKMAVYLHEFSRSYMHLAS